MFKQRTLLGFMEIKILQNKSCVDYLISGACQGNRNGKFRREARLYVCLPHPPPSNPPKPNHTHTHMWV